MNGAPRTASLLLVTLLLMQSFAVISVTANPTGGIVNTFDGGQATPSITLTAGQTNTGLGIEVPRNVTFESASFLVNAKDEVASPGQVYIDIGQDGVKEWAFEGQGYGNLGHQNSFFNGNLSAEIPSNGTAPLTTALPSVRGIHRHRPNQHLILTRCQWRLAFNRCSSRLCIR